MSDRLRILALGDSLTAGNPGFMSPAECPPSGAGNPESQYAYWIELKHPDWHVLNAGLSGERSDELLGRLSDELQAAPQACVVLSGVNDLYQGQLPEWPIRHLARIYEAVAARNIPLLICSLMPITGATPRAQSRIKEVNDWIRRTAAEQGLGFCDLHLAMSDPAHPNRLVGATKDGVHLTVDGYRRMAEAIEPALSELVANKWLDKE